MKLFIPYFEDLYSNNNVVIDFYHPFLLNYINRLSRTLLQNIQLNLKSGKFHSTLAKHRFCRCGARGHFHPNSPNCLIPGTGLGFRPKLRQNKIASEELYPPKHFLIGIFILCFLLQIKKLSPLPHHRSSRKTQ